MLFKGADLGKVASIKEVLEEAKHPLEIKYMSLTQALAIGNAEDLPEEQKEKRNCMNHIGCLENPYFFTDISGNIYTCCWRLIPPIGNILTSRLGDIVKNMGKMQKKLLAGDVRFLATDSRLKKLADSLGECMLCKEVFRGSGK